MKNLSGSTKDRRDEGKRPRLTLKPGNSVNDVQVNKIVRIDHGNDRKHGRRFHESSLESVFHRRDFHIYHGMRERLINYAN